MVNILANWPLQDKVAALTTTRYPGFSSYPFDSNNFGLHVGDEEASVIKNRQALKTSLNLPSEPLWLNQIHSNECILAEEDTNFNADAIITRDKTKVLAIMTADCLPILLSNLEGTEIAAIHAGWRGLLNGIVENTVNKMQSKPNQIIAWIGPAICQSCYETGPEVRDAYVNSYGFTDQAFKSCGQHWLANLPQLAELILVNKGISKVYQSEVCTFEKENELYSYRRNAQTGRMVSLIWFNSLNRDE